MSNLLSSAMSPRRREAEERRAASRHRLIRIMRSREKCLHVARRGFSGLVRYRTWQWRAETGQTTTEWLMVAGALAAVGIFLLELMPGAIQKFSAALIYSLRTIAL
jgi:hypothetical protein